VNKKYMPGFCTQHTSSGAAPRKKDTIIEY
jgi:hypothetical protein